MGAAASSVPPGKNQKQKSSRSLRLDPKQIYKFPLPITVHALPPLIPHNPISILQITITYLTQLVAPPSSHPRVTYRGFLSCETHSVHVLDRDTIRIFWERGFFGKGSLSRSEPSWFERERRRKSLGANETSEEVTRKRRDARKTFKKERARREAQAIEETLNNESRTAPNDDVIEPSNVDRQSGSSPSPLKETPATTKAERSPNLNAKNHNPDALLDGHDSTSANKVRNTDSNTKYINGTLEVSKFINEEHLQLSLEESFFLVYGLGVLQIRDSLTSEEVPTSSLFSLFRQLSYFPPRQLPDLQPDDPFLVSYVVYHHFRSLGWVVRPGVKFAVDYLLYNRGPVFSHAEFAVVILPAYAHLHWHSSPELSLKTRKKEKKSWWWLHCINRVQSQVRKSLILVYVEIPPPLSPRPGSPNFERGTEDMISQREEENITAALKRYKIREMTIRRWTPNRSRD